MIVFVLPLALCEVTARPIRIAGSCLEARCDWSAAASLRVRTLPAFERYRTLALQYFPDLCSSSRVRYKLSETRVVSSRSNASRVPDGPVLVDAWRSGLRDPRPLLRRSPLDPRRLGTDRRRGRPDTGNAVPVSMPALRARWPRHPPIHGVTASDLDRSRRDRLLSRRVVLLLATLFSFASPACV